MQTFMPIHQQKSLGFLVKVSPFQKLKFIMLMTYAKLPVQHWQHHNSVQQQQSHSMDALSLDPKIRLDLTNKRNEKSCSEQRSKKLVKYSCPLLSIKLKQTKFELNSPVLSVVVCGFL